MTIIKRFLTEREAARFRGKAKKEGKKTTFRIYRPEGTQLDIYCVKIIM